jgi:uncharacterized protein (TIGR03382 family)
VTKVNANGQSLAWSSFLGGLESEEGFGIAVDGSGNVYVTGETSSTDFPTMGGFDTTFGGGGMFNTDAFVTKVNANGQSLAWSSYLGGSGGDYGYGIAVDGSGNVYVTGYTESADFPTPGGLDTTLGGSRDAFVTKVNTGGSLAWSSFLGGSDSEVGRDVAVDGSGNVYVTGVTESADFPTPGGFDATRGGPQDAFVTKVNANGQSLAWSSYLGGLGTDEGYGIAVDGSGNVYVTGRTSSTDFPTPGGFDTTFGGNNYYDAFVTKVNANGQSLAWSSYLGGSARDEGRGIAVDGSGNVYVTGVTESTDFPATGGFDTTFGGGTSDAFVVKIAGGGGAQQAGGCGCTAAPSVASLVPWAFIALALVIRRRRSSV